MATMTRTSMSSTTTTFAKEPLPVGTIRISTHPELSFVPLSITPGQFAFARVNGEVSLIQASSVTTTSLTINIFTHEFISIFRLSQSLTFSPSSPDLRILEILEDGVVLYEEENETCFLAKDVLERLRKVKERSQMLRSSKGHYFGINNHAPQCHYGPPRSRYHQYQRFISPSPSSFGSPSHPPTGRRRI